MSAWACHQAGLPVVILSPGKKSRLGGAQFLHAPIPGIHGAKVPQTRVQYFRRGEPDLYRKKAFGDLDVEWRPWTDGGQPQFRDAWSLDRTYTFLWNTFEHAVRNDLNTRSVGPEWIREEGPEFSMVISTVPLLTLCEKPKEHKFITQEVLIYPEAFEGMPDDTVLYDGTPDKSWYRCSNIFGTSFTEWGAGSKTPPGLEMIRDYKPMSSSCDCLDMPGVIKVGRRGKWDAREFSHGAYYDTMTAIGVLYGR